MNERTKKVYDAFEQKQFRNKLELKRNRRRFMPPFQSSLNSTMPSTFRESE